MPEIVTKRGESISSFLGFTSFIRNFIHKYKPKRICIAFDESLGTCFRNKIYPNYKSNRPYPPSELIHQFELCKNFLTIIGIRNYSSRKYEADDLLCTMSQKNTKLGIRNIIITNDKDLFQLIYSDDIWWNYNNKKYNYSEIEKLLGFSPRFMPDYQALMGDTVDCIPGAPGIGSSTARKLISEYNTLDKVYENLGELTKKFGQRYSRISCILRENKKIVYKSKKLATLCDIKNFSITDKIRPANIKKLEHFFEKVGIRENVILSWRKLLSKNQK